MRSFTIVSLFFLLSFLSACTQQDFLDTANAPVDVQLSAAFTSLDRVDVYDMSGEYMETIDSSVDFQDVLTAGTYYMDFVNEDGDHSFMDDGRLAFAPMGEGMTPLDDPFDIYDQPMWQVAVDQVLEGNARLNIRIRDGDETLRPWAHKLGMENEDGNEEESTEDEAVPKFHTFSSTSSARLRLIWEASYAMTGSPGGSCSTTSGCWTATGTIATGNYVGDDAAAWSSLRSGYGTTTGNVSCKDSSAATSTSVVYLTQTSGSTTYNYICKQATNSSSASSYTTQRSGYYKGGQCKAFSNLVAYRSGIYHTGGSVYTWKTLPSDSSISASTSTYPVLSTSNITAGQVARMPSGHAMIIVAVSGSSATVMDSNWVGTTTSTSGSTVTTSYYEQIGAHTMSFYSSGSYNGTVSDLDSYRHLDCIFSTSPC